MTASAPSCCWTIFFLLWSFLKTDPGPQNRKLESSVMLRDPDQGHYSPKTPSEVLKRLTKNNKTTPPGTPLLRPKPEGMQTHHAAILNNGSAWERRYTDTVRKTAPQRGQRLASQSGNIRHSSSCAWGSSVNGLYSGCPSWARA